MTFSWDTPCVLGVDQVYDAAVGSSWSRSRVAGGHWGELRDCCRQDPEWLLDPVGSVKLWVAQGGLVIDHRAQGWEVFAESI